MLLFGRRKHCIAVWGGHPDYPTQSNARVGHVDLVSDRSSPFRCESLDRLSFMCSSAPLPPTDAGLWRVKGSLLGELHACLSAERMRSGTARQGRRTWNRSVPAPLPAPAWFGGVCVISITTLAHRCTHSSAQANGLGTRPSQAIRRPERALKGQDTSEFCPFRAEISCGAGRYQGVALR